MIAWLTTGGALLGTLFFYWRNGELSGLALGAFLLFFALSAIISFGNFVDRNTEIHLTQDQVSYRSPIRQTDLEWQDIEKITLMPSNNGWRVQVIGERGYLRYQSHGSLRFGGLDEMRVGVPGGEAIAAFIRQKAGLDEIEKDGQQWVCRRS